MSPRERAAGALYVVLTWLTWALFAVCVAAVLASCSHAQAEPKPDAYLVIIPTSTTLPEPGYVPVPAGPPAGVAR